MSYRRICIPERLAQEIEKNWDVDYLRHHPEMQGVPITWNLRVSQMWRFWREH